MNNEFDTFDLSKEGPNLKLVVKIPPNAEILRSQYLNVVIRARRATETESFATISLDIESKEQKPPAFQKNLYEGILEETDKKLTLEEIILDSETFSSDVVFEYGGIHHEIFDFIENENAITITLKESENIEEIMENEFLRILITARKEGFTATTVEVIIRTIPTIISNPEFEKDFYVGTLQQSSLIIDSILITEESFVPEIQIYLEGDDREYFFLTREGRSISVTLQENAQIPSGLKYLSLMILASKTKASQTATALISVIIDHDFTTETQLKFSSNLYEGSITDEFILNLEKITLNEDTFTEQVNVQLSGRHSEFFTFTRSGNEITILLRNDIGFDQLPITNYLQLSISAASDGLTTASANIIVAIERPIENSEALSFNKKLFEGSITDELVLNLEKITLNENTFTEQVNVQLSGRHSEFFTFTRSGNEITILLRNDIGFDQLPNAHYLQLSISAASDGLTTASANIIVAIERPIENSEALSFNKKLFEGSITDELVLNLEKITLNENTFTEQVNVQLSGRHSEFFTFTRSGNEITILLRNDIGFDQLPNAHYLQLSISAASDGLTTASANIIVAIERPIENSEALSFNKKLFEGSITDELVLNLEKITLNENTFTEQVNVQLSGRHSEFFTFTRSGNEITILLRNDIGFDQLPNAHYLQLSISAASDGLTTASANIIVAIERPIENSEALSFNKKLFEGSITDELVLNLEKITLNENTFTEQVNVQLSGRHSEFFTFTRSGNEITILLRNDIGFDQLPITNYLQLSISAASDGLTTASANIIVAIERPIENSEALSFNKKLFEGSITDELVLNLEKITLNENTFTEQVNVQLSGRHSEFFTFTRSGNEITILLRNDIGFDQLPNAHYLQLSISAASDGLTTASANIIVAIERPIENSEALSFNKKLFEGSITDELVLNLEKITLNENTFTEQVNVQLSGRHSEFFTFTRSGNEITILLRNDIGFDQLPNAHYLQLSISAASDGLTTASANIIVAIERPIENSEALSFNKKLFEGSITDELVLNLEKITLNENTFTEQVNVQLSGRHSEFFTFTRSGNEITILLRNDIGFDQLPITNYLQLSISAASDGLTTASANIIVAIERPIENSEALSFNKKLFEGSITDELVLNLEKITLNENTFTEQVNVQLSGRHSEFFTFTRSGNEITILLRNDIGFDQLPNAHYFQLSISAASDGLRLIRRLWSLQRVFC